MCLGGPRLWSGCQWWLGWLWGSWRRLGRLRTPRWSGLESCCRPGPCRCREGCSFELAAQAVTEGLVESISSSTVRRWLAAAVIKPWQYRS